MQTRKCWRIQDVSDVRIYGTSPRDSLPRHSAADVTHVVAAQVAQGRRDKMPSPVIRLRQCSVESVLSIGRAGQGPHRPPG